MTNLNIAEAMGKLVQGPGRALAAPLLLLLLYPGATGAPRAEDSSLQRALGLIQAAFAGGDAARLAPLLPTQGKVHLSLPALDISPGYYSAGQCRYLLADAFGRHPVRSFSLEPPADPPASPRVSVRGQLRAGPPGQEGEPIAIHFLLSREDEAWTLREIRQASRP